MDKQMNLVPGTVVGAAVGATCLTHDFSQISIMRECSDGGTEGQVPCPNNFFYN